MLKHNASICFQLKMRTGGVDQARMGRRKRSPKPKPKKMKPSLTPQPGQGSSHTSPQTGASSSGEPVLHQIDGGRDGQKEVEIEQAMAEDIDKSTDSINREVS